MAFSSASKRKPGGSNRSQSLNFQNPKSPLGSGDCQAQQEQNIKVFVRVRPLNASEKSQHSKSIVDVSGSKEIVLHDKAVSMTTKKFGFDRAFGPTSQQVEVHKAVVKPLIKQVLEGYNCTVFAYGQTGTGKTYTMEGSGEIRGHWEKDPHSGLIPRAISDLFDGLRTSDAEEYTVKVSFLELYNEEIFDLLSGPDDQTKLKLFEDMHRKGSVITQGLEEVLVKDKTEVLKILERGSIKRQTAETKMNAASSRSHTIFTVTVWINQHDPEGLDMLKQGKLNLVDLAGSENVGRSGAKNQRAREAGSINQSLLTLGRVICSLVDRTPHIPYRESKLTRLLQDSLGGRTKTSIIATISPAHINHEETLSTLDYAHRAKNITNKPEVNQQITKREKLLDYHHEIDRLKLELSAARDKQGVYLPKDTYDDQIQTQERQEEEIKSLTKMVTTKEEELEQFVEHFNDTKAKLEKITEEYEKTRRDLSCTRSVLHKTELDKQQEEHLKQKHIETEMKVTEQAKGLLNECNISTKENSMLHDKLDRLKNVQDSNDEIKAKFQSEYEVGQKFISNIINLEVSNQSTNLQKIEDRAVRNTEVRDTNKEQISEKYADTIKEIIHKLGTIKQLVNDNDEAEQTWVSELMTEAKSTVDIRSKEFQDYFANTVLHAVNEIKTAATKQNDIIQNMSQKIDTTIIQQWINQVNKDKSSALKEWNDCHKALDNATATLKEQSEDFVTNGKNAWTQFGSKLDKTVELRRTESVIICKKIKEHQLNSRHLATTSIKELRSALDQQSQTEKSELLSQQEELSNNRENLQKFEQEANEKMKDLVISVSNFVNKDLKQNVSYGNTPMRSERKFPGTIIEGTPDEIRRKRFQTNHKLRASMPKTLQMDDIAEEDVFSSTSNSTDQSANEKNGEV